MISSKSYCFFGIVTLLYCFFLASLVVHTIASPMLNRCRRDQRDTLLEFKHEFPVNESHSNPYLGSWNKISDCCSWEGVTCDAKSGEVISLDLDSIPLNNSMKPNSGLFKLHHLRNLSLSLCNLYGEIPSSLGNLSHLTDLHLSYNNLVGEFPASVGNLTQLRYLSLGNNKFSGNIPLSFANLRKLSHLGISRNQFTGDIFPLLLQNLTTSLSFLDISYNLFRSSTLPSDMSRFHSLEEIDVAGNSFSGPFPASLFTIPSLTSVDLSGNQFKGPIEFRNISSSSSMLQYIFLDRNKLDGPIPKSISNFSNLVGLTLTHNNLTGPIPTSVSKLVNLLSLGLSNNNLTGPIPRSISNLDKLAYLDLSNNKLEGEIPGCLGRLPMLMLSHNSFTGFEKSFEDSGLTEIRDLDLGSNSFLGPLPHWICKLRLVELLDLSNNNFTGSIPQCLRHTTVQTLNLQNNNLSGTLRPELFLNATELVSLDVSGNHLDGKLPESLINCTSLQLLNVGRNRIKDMFPSWLGSLPSLKVMILRSNELYGPLSYPPVSIGFQSLQIIDILHNDLNGTLPPFYFSNWREMTTLTEALGGLIDMYMVDILSSGIYSSSMELVNKGVDTKFEQIRKDFRAIDFSRNSFSGKIPISIGLLKGLHLLNLSGNAFTDNIPQSVANLTNLEALDLSRNQLSGQIPPDLGGLSFLSIMNFSHNNLEGPIPRGTQFQRQNCSTFIDNPRLYGLEDVCGQTHVPNPTLQESEDLSEPQEQVISWIAAAVAYGPGVLDSLNLETRPLSSLRTFPV